MSHSRIKDTIPESPYSEVWTDIAKGALNASFESKIINSTVIYSPKEYHSIPEFLCILDRAAKARPDYLIIPFSPESPQDHSKFIEILKKFKGKVVAVNVPPRKKDLSAINNVVGYVGMNECSAGEKAMEYIAGFQECDAVLIVEHEQAQHSGHALRIQGIKSVAEAYGIKTYEVPTMGIKNNEIVIPELLSNKNLGFITLGNRGTEAVLNCYSVPEDAIIAGMDINKVVAEAICTRPNICTFIQHPKQEGSMAIKLAENPPKTYKEVFCGPTMVDRDNVSVFWPE